MKTILTYTLILICLSGLGQSHSDKQQFEVSTSSLSEFHLYNRKGNVKVRGVDGQVAKVMVTRTLKSSSSKKLEEAKTELRLDSMMVDDAVYFYVRTEDHVFEINEDGKGSYNSCCWKSARDNRIRVSYNLDIVLEVPRNMKLNVATHHEDLEIEGFDGELYARNHHDNLTAKNLGGKVTLLNHHGDIRASFTKNPTSDCVYKTHHGDIKISFQNDLSAIASFRTHHGAFYTEFDWSPEPVAVVKTSSGKGTRYEVGNKTSVRIKKGGPQHEFKTWHGDIYLNKF